MQIPHEPADLTAPVRRRPEEAHRLPPHSPDAELGAIGCLLNFPTECVPILESRLSDPELFYDLRHQTIAKTILSMARAGTVVSLPTLVMELRDSGLLDASGGVEILTKACDAGSFSGLMESFCRQIEEKAGLRRILNACRQITEAVYAGDQPSEEIVAEAEAAMLRTGSRAADSELSAAEMANDFESRSDRGEELVRYTFGIPALDSAYRPAPGDMVIIAGRPKSGKTAVAMSMALGISTHLSNPRRTGFISMEMTHRVMTHRAISVTSGLPFATVEATHAHRDLHPQARQQLRDGTELYRKSNLRLFCEPGLSVHQIGSIVRRWKANHGTEVVFIDYVQRISTGSYKSRYEGVTAISNALKDLALSCNVCLIVLAQINREAGEATDRPSVNHLRDSGALEQDADAIGLIQRSEKNNEVYVHFDYIRNGAPCTKVLAFDGPTMTIYDPAFV